MLRCKSATAGLPMSCYDGSPQLIRIDSLSFCLMTRVPEMHAQSSYQRRRDDTWLTIGSRSSSQRKPTLHHNTGRLSSDGWPQTTCYRRTVAGR